MTTRRVRGSDSTVQIRTSRIGLLTIHAVAPVVDGEVSDAELSFTVRIDEVSTGNPLLDPELHALIHEITSGTLQFVGQRAGEVYAGTASAGDITVPLSLALDPEQTTAQVRGSSTFSNLHVPLPGMGHIKHLQVDIDGHLHLE